MIDKANENKSASVASLSADESLYNLSILEEMDDNEYVVEIIGLFLKDTPKELREIQDALAGGKIEIIHKKAHKLKSSAGVLQANKLIDLLDRIESIAKSGKLGEELSQFFKNAQQA